MMHSSTYAPLKFLVCYRAKSHELTCKRIDILWYNFFLTGIRKTMEPKTVTPFVVTFTVLKCSWRQLCVSSNETPTWCHTVQVLFLQSHSAEIKPAQCCIKLVFHLTYTMMHGSTKLKFVCLVLIICRGRSVVGRNIPMFSGVSL